MQTQNQRALLNELEELLVRYAVSIFQRESHAESVVIANCASWWRCLACAHTRVSRASCQYQEARVCFYGAIQGAACWSGPR